MNGHPSKQQRRRNGLGGIVADFPAFRDTGAATRRCNTGAAAGVASIDAASRPTIIARPGGFAM
jgi:hypothetical protein